MSAEAFPVLDEPGRPMLRTYTAPDGYDLHYRHFAAENPKGAVVFLHGIQSHGGWYQRSCAAIAAAGFDVYFLDRRGAGLNPAARGDSPSFRLLLDDVAGFLDQLPEGRPKPILAAISWGGKLGAAFNYRHPNRIGGLILLCPGFCPRIRPPFFQRLAIAWYRTFGPTRLFPVPLSDPKLFTASERWQKFIADDPLATRNATARFLFDSNSLDIYLRRAKRAVTVPTLLMLGERDQIIFNDKTKIWFGRLPCADKVVIEYAGAEHTLEFEGDKSPFRYDIIGWLNTH